MPALRTTRATGCQKEDPAAARAQVGEVGVGRRCLDASIWRQDVNVDQLKIPGSIPELPKSSSW